MLTAYVFAEPIKNVPLLESQEIFQQNFLPLCLSHSSLIEPEGEFNTYLGLEPIEPLLPLKKLLEEAVPTTCNRVLIGLGSSKLMARVALKVLKQQLDLTIPLKQGIISISKSSKGIILWITPGREVDFLSPLPLSFLPIGAKEQLQLFLLGVKTIGELRKLPLSALTKKFGQIGYLWQEYSSGKDYTPILSLYPPDQITYQQNFPYGLTNKDAFNKLFNQLGIFLAEKLQQKEKGCQSLSLQINDEFSGKRSFSRPTYEVETLVTNLLILFQELKLNTPLFRLQIKAEKLKAFSYHQLNLFEANLVTEIRRTDSTTFKPAKTVAKLEKTITNLQKRYNSSFIIYGKDLKLSRREAVLKIWDPLRSSKTGI